MTKPNEKNETASAPDQMSALQGRFDAFTSATTDLLSKMAAKIQENTAALEAMTARFGELSISAPRLPSSEQVPLTKAQISDILIAKPSAAFRLLADLQHPLCQRSKGAILRPQTMQPNVWRAVLDVQAKLADADESP